MSELERERVKIKRDKEVQVFTVSSGSSGDAFSSGQVSKGWTVVSASPHFYSFLPPTPPHPPPMPLFGVSSGTAKIQTTVEVNRLLLAFLHSFRTDALANQMRGSPPPPCPSPTHPPTLRREKTATVPDNNAWGAALGEGWGHSVRKMFSGLQKRFLVFFPAPPPPCSFISGSGEAVPAVCREGAPAAA